ncbi:MAG: glycosyltransferase family 4 protein, partial [Candidatus Sumerlaeota bacterium]
RNVKSTAQKIRGLSWFSSITHVGAHLLRADAVARAIVKETRLPYLLTEHGLHGLGEGPPLTKPFMRKWYRDTFSENAIAAGVSPKVCRELNELLATPDKIALMQNGIDLEQFRIPTSERRAGARERFGIPGNAFPVIATIGALAAHKDTALSVEILRILSKRNDCAPHLLLCGEGPLRDEVESRLFQWKLHKRANLTGLLDDTADVYAAADIVVHPSPQESFGLVIAEACASGLPVLTRAGSGADEIAPPWPLAAAVDGRDPEVWAQSALGLRGGMEKEARSYAEKNFSIIDTARRYVELLGRLR